MIWFHHRLKSTKRKLFLPVAAIYLVASVAVFAVSMMLPDEFLDGIVYILIGGLFLVVFWLLSTIAIIRKHIKAGTKGLIISDLAQMIILLVVPLILWFWLSNASLKIGG